MLLLLLLLMLRKDCSLPCDNTEREIGGIIIQFPFQLGTKPHHGKKCVIWMKYIIAVTLKLNRLTVNTYHEETAMASITYRYKCTRKKIGNSPSCDWWPLHQQLEQERCWQWTEAATARLSHCPLSWHLGRQLPTKSMWTKEESIFEQNGTWYILEADSSSTASAISTIEFSSSGSENPTGTHIPDIAIYFFSG
jgi:hypothetical protein